MSRRKKKLMDDTDISEKPSGLCREEALRELLERTEHLEKLAHRHIEERATAIHDARVRAGLHGTDFSDWLEAEKQVCEVLDKHLSAKGLPNNVERSDEEVGCVASNG